MVARLACASVVAFTLVRSPASAAPSTSPEPEPIIDWNAPSTCPMGDVVDRIAGLVGLPRARLGEKLLRVDANLSHRSDGSWGMRLGIQTTAGSGERSFEAEDCRSLADGTALIVALTIDPTIPARRPTDRATDKATGQPATAAQFERQGSAPAQLRLLLRPLLVADLGVLPDASFGFGLAAGGSWRLLRFEIDGTVQPEQQLTDPQAPSRGGRVRTLLRSGARSCLGVWQSRIEIDGCLGAAASWMRATGQYIAHPETNDALWVAILAGLAASVHLYDRLWLRAEGHIGVSMRRPSFEIGPETEIYRSRALTERVGLGLEARL